jgi:hypothetical protein
MRLSGKRIWASEKHLTDEALVILAGSHCSDKVRESASAHLRECEGCRVRLEDTRRVRSAWAEILDRGLLNEQRSGVRPKTAPHDARFSFPWKPIMAVLSLSVITFVVFLNAITGRAASASGILTDAIASEQRLGFPKAFRLDVAGETCGRGLEAAEDRMVNVSPPCIEGISLMRRSAWATQKPLSVQAFAAWRDSLPRRKDIITKQSDSLRIQTLAFSGLLREASLTLRAGDYHPTSLVLVFENQEEVRLMEDVPAPVMDVVSAQPKLAIPAPKAAPAPVDPLDESESNAWARLGQLHADTGWEATVVRQVDEVEIKAKVASPEREQQLRVSFKQDPDVKFDIHVSTQSSDVDAFLAQRHLTGDSPALAHDWLEQAYPDVEARSKFSNGALDLSKAILGRAFFLDQLRQSRSKMSPSPSAQKMSELISQEEILLGASQAALASELQPLIGKPKQSVTKPLTYGEAGELDAALGALLAASSKDNQEYENQIAIVQGLL